MKDTVYFIVISLIIVVMAYFVAFGCEKLIEKENSCQIFIGKDEGQQAGDYGNAFCGGSGIDVF